MTTVLGMSLASLAVAAWIAALPARAPASWRFTARRWWPTSARIIGLAATVGSAAVFAGPLGPWPGALLAGGAVTAAASLAILLLPLAPRLLWRCFAVLLLAGSVAGIVRGLGG